MSAAFGLLLVVFSLLLTGCAATTKPTTEVPGKQISTDLPLQSWRMTGRLALFDAHDSWTANLDWKHKPGDELLKLTGPLGQGAIVIALFGDCVTVTQGLKTSESSCQVDELIGKYLGVEIPVSYLGFWVLGQPAPGQAADQYPNGFSQAGWDVSIRETVQVDNQLLPKKLFISQNKSKLKLVIDQWMLNEH